MPISILKRSVIFLVITTLFACGSSNDDDASVPENSITIETPNSFLKPINTQASLVAGKYKVVVATRSAGKSGDYELEISFDDGEKKIINGSWNNSGGQSVNSDANPRHGFTLESTGGIELKLNSSVNAYIYLLKNGQIIAENGTVGNVHIKLDASQVNSATFARAYYRAVDPNDDRTTFAAWKTVNGFDQGHDYHVVFRDAKDLGYGRDMYLRTNDDGSMAVYVNNYVVNVFESDAENYGPLNVEAAVDEQREHYIGTNAIEFSAIDHSDDNSDKVVKFFVFVPDGSGDYENVPRALSANLDGRGNVFMPTGCYACHSRSAELIKYSGRLSGFSLHAAKLNSLEVDSFEFADRDGYREGDQSKRLKNINKVVRDVLTVINNRDDSIRGHWDGDYSLQLANANYKDFTTSNYRANYVPPGWRENADRPENVQQLYLDVVKPHCFACHSQQGTTAAEGVTVVVDGVTVSLANAINFSSYEKFISYNDKIIDYVYKRGVMPLSLRNFESFWDEDNDAPVLLASFLEGFDGFDENRNILKPGKPVARPGDTRTVVSPVQLDAGASTFAANYAWSVVSAPDDAVAEFSDAAIAAPIFTADSDGEYVLRLSVSNALGEHSADTTIVINESLTPRQSRLNFADDIVPILGSGTLTLCANCHNDGLTMGAVTGIPVYFDDSNDNLYKDVMTRVDLREPENSLLLRKPTSLFHGGGVQISRSTIVGDEKYNTLLNWIREGGLCGDDPAYCN